jgi:hypothetical protein
MTDRKKKDPWTDPDPHPRDFDEYFAEMGPEHIPVVEAGEGPELIVLGDETIEEYRAKKRRKEARATR